MYVLLYKDVDIHVYIIQTCVHEIKIYYTKIYTVCSLSITCIMWFVARYPNRNFIFNN